MQVRLAVLDKAVVRVEDEEGAEGYVEQHDGHVHVSCCEPRLGDLAQWMMMMMIGEGNYPNTDLSSIKEVW